MYIKVCSPVYFLVYVRHMCVYISAIYPKDDSELSVLFVRGSYYLPYSTLLWFLEFRILAIFLSKADY